MYISLLVSAFIQEIKKEDSKWTDTPYFPQKSTSVPCNTFVKKKNVKVQFAGLNDLIFEGQKTEWDIVCDVFYSESMQL